MEDLGLRPFGSRFSGPDVVGDGPHRLAERGPGNLPGHPFTRMFANSSPSTTSAHSSKPDCGTSPAHVTACTSSPDRRRRTPAAGSSPARRSVPCGQTTCAARCSVRRSSRDRERARTHRTDRTSRSDGCGGSAGWTSRAGEREMPGCRRRGSRRHPGAGFSSARGRGSEPVLAAGHRAPGAAEDGQYGTYDEQDDSNRPQDRDVSDEPDHEQDGT
jgi:hypothetical protein